MSGLAAFLTPESITFAVDTLVTRNDSFPMVKIGSVSKYNFYPHIKCCVVAFGTTRIGHDYHEFINSLVLSEIDDLVDLTERLFLGLIDPDDYPKDGYKNKEDANSLGNLYVMGYSDKKRKMCSYIIYVKKDNISVREMNMNIRKHIHPPIEEEIQDLILEKVKKIEGAGVEQVLIESIKQMAKDSENENTFTVGVGMEIHLVTLMVVNGHFVFSSGTAFRFDNFESELTKMAKNQEDDLITRTVKFNANKKDRIKALGSAYEKTITIMDKVKALEAKHPELEGTWNELTALFNETR